MLEVGGALFTLLIVLWISTILITTKLIPTNFDFGSFWSVCQIKLTPILPAIQYAKFTLEMWYIFNLSILNYRSIVSFSHKGCSTKRFYSPWKLGWFFSYTVIGITSSFLSWFSSLAVCSSCRSDHKSRSRNVPTPGKNVGVAHDVTPPLTVTIT